MMKTENNIMGVVPGNRYTGYAVLCSTDLWDWGIKSSRELKLDNRIDELTKFIIEIIENYRISVIVTKSFHESRTSENLEALNKSIQQIVRKRNLFLYEYSIERMKQYLLPEGKTNIDLLMKEISLQFPCLLNEYNREIHNRNKYFSKVFEAVALGMVGLNARENIMH